MAAVLEKKIHRCIHRYILYLSDCLLQKKNEENGGVDLYENTQKKKLVLPTFFRRPGVWCGSMFDAISDIPTSSMLAFD